MPYVLSPQVPVLGKRYRPLYLQIADANDAGLFTAWWNISDTSTVWLASDETGGNVTADGDTIGKIDDQTANGYDITQTTAAQEPRYTERTSGGVTFYTFDTDGSDDSIGNTSMTLSSDCSVFFTAMRLDNNPGVILSGTSAVNGRWIGIYGSGGTAPLSSNAGSPTFYVDGSQVVNSGELYTALAGPNMNLFEARNVDMVTSPWAGVVFSGHGSVKPNIAFGPHAIIIPTANLTPALRAAIVAFLNGSVGI